MGLQLYVCCGCQSNVSTSHAQIRTNYYIGSYYLGQEGKKKKRSKQDHELLSLLSAFPFWGAAEPYSFLGPSFPSPWSGPSKKSGEIPSGGIDPMAGHQTPIWPNLTMSHTP